MYSTKKQIEIIKKRFAKIRIINSNISSEMIEKCLLGAVAMFSLKFPSLLQFDQSREDKIIRHNLRTLFCVEDVPSDTYIRKVLDQVEIKDIRRSYVDLFRELQKGKKLEKFRILNGVYLVPIDGTQHFSSHEIRCENCCEKHHRNGSTTYHHNLLAAAIVKPGLNAVIPFCPEPILKQDGEVKNDCEQVALKRLLLNLRREHPHLRMMVTLDGLYSNAPVIQLLKELNFNYIIVAKSSDHQHLFNEVESSEKTKVIKYTDSKGTIHRYEYVNGVALNASNPDVKVNFLQYIEIKDGKKETYFSWVTDTEINEQNIKELVKAGRARWKIENETFNTLKNQGYQLEHNFGHGYKNLSSVFSLLMMLAFFIDQIQLIGSIKFQNALKSAKSKVRLWFKMRSLFCNFLIKSWDDLLQSIAFKHKSSLLIPDTG